MRRPKPYATQENGLCRSDEAAEPLLASSEYGKAADAYAAAGLNEQAIEHIGRRRNAITIERAAHGRGVWRGRH